MRLADIAHQAGAVDLFALTALESDRQWFNVGGVGRGDGWAGNLTLDTSAEPMLAKAVVAGYSHTHGSHPRRIFGPYWAASASVVGNEKRLVVFGGDNVTDDVDLLDRLADEVDALVEHVSTSKLEADAAEIAQARRAVTELIGADGGVTGSDLARVAADALGCEFAAVLSADNEISIADRGWRPAADDSEIIAALFPLRRAAATALHVEQDAESCDVAVRPLSRQDGVVSFAAASVTVGGRPGTLVVAHTGNRPRGFTDLCHEVLRTIVDEAV